MLHRELTQAGDRELAGDDHHRHPGAHAAELDEAHERGRDQQLVRQRVHQLAERGHALLPAGDPPVQGVRERRECEHRGGDSVQSSAFLHERRDEHGHEQNPQEGQDVRQIELEHPRLNVSRGAGDVHPGGR